LSLAPSFADALKVLTGCWFLPDQGLEKFLDFTDQVTTAGVLPLDDSEKIFVYGENVTMIAAGTCQGETAKSGKSDRGLYRLGVNPTDCRHRRQIVTIIHVVGDDVSIVTAKDKLADAFDLIDALSKTVGIRHGIPLNRQWA